MFSESAQEMLGFSSRISKKKVCMKERKKERKIERKKGINEERKFRFQSWMDILSSFFFFQIAGFYE